MGLSMDMPSEKGVGQPWGRCGLMTQRMRVGMCLDRWETVEDPSQAHQLRRRLAGGWPGSVSRAAACGLQASPPVWRKQKRGVRITWRDRSYALRHRNELRNIDTPYCAENLGSWKHRTTAVSVEIDYVRSQVNAIMVQMPTLRDDSWHPRLRLHGSGHGSDYLIHCMSEAEVGYVT